MGKRRRRTAVLCAVVVGVGLTGISGCGDSGEESPKGSRQGGTEVQRMSAALKTLKGYDTVRMTGSYSPVGPVDLRVDRDGNCVGTMGYPGESRVEIIQVGGERAWYRHEDASLASVRRMAEYIGPGAVARHDEAAKKARGKYIESSAAEVKDDQRLTLCDLDRAFAEVPDSASKAKALNPITQDGERIVELVEQPESDGVTVHITVKGDPLPRKVKFELNDERAELELRDADKPVPATPPPAAETVPSAEVTGLFPEIPEHMRGE
ncbi:hypothetical protein [Streptomyces sp. NPDC006645]|uniref:hypothetical protein n=1 Tax=unclassified Streptomyces TaxID=2593676 RepID=UPI00339F26B1